jgi:hypothetical protein
VRYSHITHKPLHIYLDDDVALTHENSYQLFQCLTFCSGRAPRNKYGTIEIEIQVLFQYLFPATESHTIDALVVMLQGYYHDFQERLPSDPAYRLDPFFDMVSVAVSPKVVPPANGKDQKLQNSADYLAGVPEGRKTATEVLQLDHVHHQPASPAIQASRAAGIAGGDSSSADAGALQVSGPCEPVVFFTPIFFDFELRTPRQAYDSTTRPSGERADASVRCTGLGVCLSKRYIRRGLGRVPFTIVCED